MRFRKGDVVLVVDDYWNFVRIVIVKSRITRNGTIYDCHRIENKALDGFVFACDMERITYEV